MGAIELLLPKKLINLLRRKNFPEPALEGGLIGDGPFGTQHLPSGPITRDFANSQMHIGMALVMGEAHDLFKAWGRRIAWRRR